MRIDREICFDLDRKWYLQKMAVTLVGLPLCAIFLGPNYIDAIISGDYHELSRVERAYPLIPLGAIWCWVVAIGALSTYKSAVTVGQLGIRISEFGYRANMDWPSVVSIAIENRTADVFGLVHQKDCIHIVYQQRDKKRNKWIFPAKYSTDTETLMKAIEQLRPRNSEL